MGTHRYPEEFRREAVQLYRRSGCAMEIEVLSPIAGHR